MLFALREGLRIECNNINKEVCMTEENKASENGMDERPIPSLYNPNVSANLCLLFSPIFSAILHAKNWQALGKPSAEGPVQPVFEREWHDWIVMRKGQLESFNTYILETPFRAWRRQRNDGLLLIRRTVQFLGRTWFAFGNVELLERPVLVPIKGHRSTQPDSPEWKGLVARASRIGPGGAGVSTFMSKLEKDCGNAIAKAGGGMVVLSPDGFDDRWHPSEKKERFCVEGRMLFLSLYPPQERKLTNRELHERCHEMGEIVVKGLEGKG